MKSLIFYSSIKKRAFVCLISIKVTVKGEGHIKENNLMWETISSLLISNFYNREITSLRLDMMYYPSIKKRASVFLINIFEFRVSIPKKLHPTARHDVGTEFKLFKTPFLKFPYPIKSNKSDAQEKKVISWLLLQVNLSYISFYWVPKLTMSIQAVLLL